VLPTLKERLRELETPSPTLPDPLAPKPALVDTVCMTKPRLSVIEAPRLVELPAPRPKLSDALGLADRPKSPVKEAPTLPEPPKPAP